MFKRAQVIVLIQDWGLTQSPSARSPKVTYFWISRFDFFPLQQSQISIPFLGIATWVTCNHLKSGPLKTHLVYFCLHLLTQPACHSPACSVLVNSLSSCTVFPNHKLPRSHHGCIFFHKLHISLSSDPSRPSWQCSGYAGFLPKLLWTITAVSWTSHLSRHKMTLETQVRSCHFPGENIYCPLILHCTEQCFTNYRLQGINE